MKLPEVPCQDHGNTGTCRLDLVAMTRRLRELVPMIVELQAKLRHLRSLKLSTFTTALTLNMVRRECRLLCATRAHHRGRVAEATRRSWALMDPENWDRHLARCLPLQAREVQETWALYSTLPAPLL